MDVETPLFCVQNDDPYGFMEPQLENPFSFSSPLFYGSNAKMMLTENSQDGFITMDILQQRNEEAINDFIINDDNAYFDGENEANIDDMYLNSNYEENENENECAVEPLNFESLNTEELFGKLTDEERSVIDLLKKTNERILELKKLEKEQESNMLYEPPLKRVRQ